MNRRDLFKLAGKVGLVALAQQVPWTWLERAGLVGDYLAEAGTLPLNWEERSGTQISLFGAGGIGDWTLTQTAGTGSRALDTTYTRDGQSGSLRITCDTASDEMRVTRSNYTSFDATGDYLWGFWVYVPTATDLANISGLSILVSTAGFTSFQTTTINGINMREGWNWFPRPRVGTVWTQTGATPWSARTTVRFTLISNAGGGATIYVADAWRGLWTKPWVIWTCDDFHDTQYARAKTEFAAFGIRPLVYTTANEIRGTQGDGYMTVEQAQELEEVYGWRFGLHGEDHTDLLQKTESEVRDQLEANIYELRRVFRHPRVDLLALPTPSNQPTNEIVASVAQSLGIVSIRSGVSSCAYTHKGPFQVASRYAVSPNFLYDVPTKPLDAATLAAVKTTWIDGSTSVQGPIMWGGISSFHLHNLGSLEDPEETGSNRIKLSDFKEILGYVHRYAAAGVIRHGGMHEWYDGLTNPRRRRAA